MWKDTFKPPHLIRMNRRSFFSNTLGQVVNELEMPLPAAAAPYASSTISRPTSTIAKYTGVWGYEQVSHLLRRSVFGPKREEIKLALNLTIDQLVDQLLTDLPDPAPPIMHQANNKSVYVEQLDKYVSVPNTSSDTLYVPWVTNGKNMNFENRKQSLASWWSGLMIDQSISLREKMTLFWSNHLVTSIDTVGDPRFSYEYLKILRANSFGNFKTLIKAISSNAAMLVYLSGNQNRKTAPNENYARELMELFTLGVTDKDGNDNYTEDDVVAAARVLTGWTTVTSGTGLPNAPFAKFNAANHDTGKKTFSSHFGGQSIQRTVSAEYQLELDDLVDMIFHHNGDNQVALFICRELYKWFVYYEIDEYTETNIIEPLADTFRTNNYEIKPVLKQLLSSARFFDPAVMGAQIKNPIDFTLGSIRQFNCVILPTPTQQYRVRYKVLRAAADMQMDLFNPPNVAGWKAYYQIPNFYELWINTANYITRNSYNDVLLGPTGYADGKAMARIDVVQFALTVTEAQPDKINVLIDESVKLLLPRAISTEQWQNLRNILLPNNDPDVEWENEWRTFLTEYTKNANSEPKQRRLAVYLKLTAFYKDIMSMAEFNLA